MSVKFYLIGGAVRDELMGLKVKDLDFVVVAHSYKQMRDAILGRRGEIFLETPDCFTIRGRLPDVGAADFVLARKDGVYSDGRRPDSVEIGSLYEDQKRRDFTCNAIAKDLESGELIDSFGGQQDIKDNLLRCVGIAEDRFREDSIRLLRAIRFFVTKGLQLHNDIVDCLHRKDLVDLIPNMSVERIYDELTNMMTRNTLGTLQVFRTYHYLADKIFENERIWLKPSLKER